MVARGPHRKVSRKEAEERLLVEAAQKDPVRFPDLYERCFESVYAYIARRVGNRDETEELTSEVFHRALANLPASNGAACPSWFGFSGLPQTPWPIVRIAPLENASSVILKIRRTLALRKSSNARSSSALSNGFPKISDVSSGCASPTERASAKSRRSWGAPREPSSSFSFGLSKT